MTTSSSVLTLDVHEITNPDSEVLAEIMQTASSLEPGQGLRLLAAFRSVPLFEVMSQRGYSHTERELGGGTWEVVFTRTDASAASESHLESRNPSAVAACLDVRNMPLPEPMKRVLEAVEAIGAGEVLQVLTDYEPTHLYRELLRRHHAFVSEECEEGYRITIRHSGAIGERA